MLRSAFSIQRHRSSCSLRRAFVLVNGAILFHSDGAGVGQAEKHHYTRGSCGVSGLGNGLGSVLPELLLRYEL